MSADGKSGNGKQGCDEQQDFESRGEPKNNDLVIREGFPALTRADGQGPLIDGDEPIPRQPFASYQHAVHVPPAYLDSMIEDCAKVFSAKTKDDDAAYSAGCTYFVPCQMKPRCALEALALQIFQAHVADLEKDDGQCRMYDPERSGAEWWTLVMDAATSNGETKEDDNEEGKDHDDDEEEEEDDEVGMHFDADYGLESQLRHMLLHPRVATVTYLSNVGAPTFVLDRRSPPPADVEKKTLSGDVQRAWLSTPQLGKHVCFDGRFLHGAPSAFFPGTSNQSTNRQTEKDGKEPVAKRQRLDEGGLDAKLPASVPEKRITFLVNVWLNHCPLDAELLDDEICADMTPWEHKGEETGQLKLEAPFEWRITDLSEPDQTKKLGLTASKSDSAGSEETVVCHRKITINFGASLEELHNAARQTSGGASAELAMGEGVLNIAVGEEVESSDDESQTEVNLR